MLNFNMKDKYKEVILKNEFFANWTLSCSFILFGDFVLVDDVNIFYFSKLSDVSSPLFVFEDERKKRFQQSVENSSMKSIPIDLSEHFLSY